MNDYTELASTVVVPRIHFKTHEKHISFTPDEILFCKAEGSYTRVVIQSSKNFVISRPLKIFIKCIPKSGFLRCHYSYLINIKHVESFDSKKKMVALKDYHIPVSRRKSTAVFTMLSISGIQDIHDNFQKSVFQSSY